MTDNDILKFRNEICILSLEDLKNKKLEIDEAISKMILDSDLIIKAAIVSALIDEKTEE